MKLTFEQTADDLIDLSKNSLKNNRFLKIFGIIMGCIILLNAIFFFSWEDVDMESILSWIIPIILVVIIWVIIFKVILKKRLQNPGNKKMMMGKREIELSEKEIRVWTPVSETVYQWSAVTRLGQSAKNYFLYLGKAQAIIVSKSAFKSEGEKEGFEKLVTTKIS